MNSLSKLFGQMWPVVLECMFFSLDLKPEERTELGEALYLICAEHINNQTKRK